MFEDEGTRGGDGTAEAARCGIGRKGRGRLCQWFRWRRVDDIVGEGNGRYARESSPQPGRRLRGGKVTGRNETGRDGTVQKETRFNKIAILNKFQKTSEQGSHWLIESPTIFSSMCSPPLSDICQFYF